MASERAKKSESRRRSRLVGVRLTQSEYATIEHSANACDISTADFLRRAALPGGEALRRMAATDEATS